VAVWSFTEGCLCDFQLGRKFGPQDWQFRDRKRNSSKRCLKTAVHSKRIFPQALIEELPHFIDHLLTYVLHSFVLIQKNQKIKAMNRLSAGFSSTRHHLNGPSSSSTIISK